MKRFTFFIIMTIILLSLISTVPKTLNYQGKLVNTEGIAINDTVDLTFRLYTSESGGEYLSEQFISDVPVTHGLFSVELSDFPDTVKFNDQYYLEIQLGSEILSPREKLTSSPYSIRSEFTSNAIQSVYTDSDTSNRSGRMLFRTGPGATLSDMGDSIIIRIERDETGFTINVSQREISVYRGSDITNTVSVVRLTPGLSSDVTLTVVGLPSGASATFSPTTCSPTCISTMTISTDETTPPGEYTVMVSAESDDLIRTATFTLTVNIPFDYTLVAEPNSVTIDQGSSASTSITASLLTGFPESVSYSISGLPVGALATFSPTSCILSCGSSLNITTSTTTPPGSYDCVITAMTTSGVVRTTTFTLIVEYFDFTLSASPSSATIDQGENTSVTISATRASDVPQDVDFSLLPTPMHDGITATLTSSSCTPTCNTTLNITTTETVIPNTYPIQIVANATGGAEEILTFNLTVDPFDFSLALNPSSGNILTTGTLEADVELTLNSSVTQSVTFSHSALPSGVSLDFSSVSCNPSCTSTMTFTTSGATTGNYTVDITGTAIGGSARTETFTLSVADVPDAVDDLVATAGAGSVTLDWSAPYSPLPITGYNIYRDTSPNPTVLVAELGDVLTYTDSGLSDGTTYYYRIRAENAGGLGPYSNEVNATPFTPVNLTFNNTSTGRTGTIQNWTVPYTGTFRIEAWGAEGGSGGLNPGKGARMRGDFDLNEGEVLNIIVGQRGNNASSAGGGGGGSYVVKAGTPLIVAAGGNGGNHSNSDGCVVCTGTGGVTSNNGTTNGGAGRRAGGGGGFTGNGGDGRYSNTGGKSYTNGASGGQGGTADGGYGGGGAGDWEGGGGGGYNGGVPSESNIYNSWGTPAGSYNSGTNQSNSDAVRTGHGMVTIQGI